MRVLLGDQRTKSNKVDSAGMSPLHKAAKYGRLDVIDLLTKWEEDPHKRLDPFSPAQIPEKGDTRPWAAELEGCTSLHLASME